MTIMFHTATENLPLRRSKWQLHYIWTVRRAIRSLTITF